MRTSSLFLLAVALPLVTLPRTARAGDPAAAQALFDEGNRLFTQGRFPEACAKFQESQRQDPGIGTLYHFADCEDRLGKTATAWAAFLEVASEARTQGQSARATAAQDRASAIAPHLARVTIDASAAKATPGFTLARDGQPIGPGEWATAIPVDPGAHVFEAHAPGKLGWTTTVTARDGAALTVSVPMLADAPAVATPPRNAMLAPTSTTMTTSAEVTAPHRGEGQRVTGLVLGAAGIVGMGVGGYFGVQSLLQHNDASSHCVGNVCDAAGVSYRNNAQQDGTAATIALSAGGAVFLVGLITYLTAPRGDDPPRTAHLRPTIAVGPGSVLLEGSF
jgi:hypothetical protein